MKYYLILLILCAMVLGCDAQTVKAKKPVSTKTKEFVWPKPIKDSTWSEIQCDTTFGVIEVTVGQGKMKGDGIVTSCRYWDCSKSIYSTKDQAAMDSIQAAQSRGGLMVFSTGHTCIGYNSPIKKAYIKTMGNYKEIEGNFTFIPKQ